MTSLTEDMIFARSKQSDLSLIKKLNCWGNDLSDISIVKKLKLIEVLALSVNKIKSLKPFENCKKLQELYLRKNNIQDINEIGYLKNLSDLRFLWLEDNPCCQKAGPNYRAIVLRTLPKLTKLDNIDVTEEELANALNLNVDNKMTATTQQPQQPSLLQTPQSIQSSNSSEYYQAGSTIFPTNYVQDNAQQQTARSSIIYKDECYNTDRQAYPTHYRHSQAELPDWPKESSYYNGYAYSHSPLIPNGWRRSNYEHDRLLYKNTHRSRRDNSEWDNNERYRPKTPNYRPDSTTGIPNCRPNPITGIPNCRPNPITGIPNCRPDTTTGIPNCRPDTTTDIPNCNPDSTTGTSNYRLDSTSSIYHYSNYNTRLMNRNTKLISAALCLIDELDYASLRVVEHALRCRINEIKE